MKGPVSLLVLLLGSFFLLWVSPSWAQLPVSDVTQACLDCHSQVTPGIVADWKASVHAKTTSAQALVKPRLERAISASQVTENLAGVVVGCAECHTANPKAHRDTFEHNGFQVHVVVTPRDCATCHPLEVEGYGRNIMSHAYGNLINNPVYHNLLDTVGGFRDLNGPRASYGEPDAQTMADSCLYCHGTKVEVKGFETRVTSMGEMKFPVLSGWPNQGVGRVNPGGSLGSCASCHTRHAFSIEMARKPYTCGECHKGPDVPAYKVYMVSKHGNIYSSTGKDWNFGHIPWVVGEDFRAPTCATCHASLIVDGKGNVIAERTHQMNDRSPWRIFGLIYAHPHPRAPDTTIIRNRAGLPLPTELTGKPVSQYLVDAQEMARRREAMERVCMACHATSWVRGQFARFEHTIKTTNAMTLAATQILLKAWETGAASGLARGDSIFNETIEEMWVEQWLFYANSTRFASAMAGADYGAFANGRWFMSKNIRQMADWLQFRLRYLKKAEGSRDK